jgi:hypothetical protein
MPARSRHQSRRSTRTCLSTSLLTAKESRNARSTPSAIAATPDWCRLLDACGGMLSALARARPTDVRGWHPYGVSDPGGFAAMGTVEVLVHLLDVSVPLGLAWEPHPSVVRRVLGRLFPQAPSQGDPWQILLHATGRDPESPVELVAVGRDGQGAHLDHRPKITSGASRQWSGCNPVSPWGRPPPLLRPCTGAGTTGHSVRHHRAGRSAAAALPLSPPSRTPPAQVVRSPR